MRHSRWLYFMLLFLVISTITGCKTSLPDKQKIKADLVERQVNYTNYAFQISSESEIKSINIIKRDTNRKNRQEVVTAYLELENENVRATGEVILDYSYAPDHGWNLSSITPTLSQNLTLLKGIAQQDILQALSDQQVVIDSYNQWSFANANIESINILKQETSFDDFYDEVEVDLKSESEYESLDARLAMKFSLSNGQAHNGWFLDNIEVIQASRKLTRGIDQSLVQELLIGERITDIFNITIGSKQYNYVWNIKQVDQVDIVDHDLTDWQDHIQARVTLTRDNMEVNGTVSIQFNYRNGEWSLIEILPTGSFDYELIHAVNITEDSIQDQLVGKEVTYYSGFFNREVWKIEQDNFQDLDIIGIRPLEYGKTVECLANLTLKDASRTIQGSVTLSYELANENWSLQDYKFEMSPTTDL